MMDKLPVFVYWNFCSTLIPISWETWISFDFKSVSLWEESWRCLSDPSLVSSKNWLSGTVGTCSLEAPQLWVRSYDRRGMAFRYTPTTQVAVVCLVKKKKNVFYFRIPRTASFLSFCDAVCFHVWLLVSMSTVTHILSCPFATWLVKVKFP